MWIKRGVSPRGIRTQILLALFIADQVYRDFGLEMIMTSGSEGKHGYGSLHYVGLGCDVDAVGVTDSQQRDIAAEIKKRLGEEYDVVSEATHIHIEYQPKTQMV